MEPFGPPRKRPRPDGVPVNGVNGSNNGGGGGGGHPGADDCELSNHGLESCTGHLEEFASCFWACFCVFIVHVGDMFRFVSFCFFDSTSRSLPWVINPASGF